MGSKMPVLSGRDVVKTFERFGWTIARQASSHIILIKPGEIISLSVPDHKGSRSRYTTEPDPFGESDR
jgi:predicted RNA binding protein YcfA (HicA-like mRNA interferase family)